MNVLRRAWRVYADPPASEAAKLLKVLIPVEAAAWIYQVSVPEGWPMMPGTTLVQVFSWCLMLWFVRERDKARAELSTYKTALQGAPLVVEAVNRRRAEQARDADR